MSMSLLNLLTFGLFGSDDTSKIDSLKEQLDTCKDSKNKYKNKCKKYEERLCENMMVPVHDKFTVYDKRGKFNLFELSDGKFVNVTLDPLPCKYNGYKKNYWNCHYHNDDGVYCLAAGTVDEFNPMDEPKLNPPHQGDKVIMKFKVHGKKMMKFLFRYKVIGSDSAENGKFRLLCNGIEQFSTSDTFSDVNNHDGWLKGYVNLKCYDVVTLVYERNIECDDADEQVFIKDLCLYGGYMKAVPKKHKKKYYDECSDDENKHKKKYYSGTNDEWSDDENKHKKYYDEPNKKKYYKKTYDDYSDSEF